MSQFYIFIFSFAGYGAVVPDGYGVSYNPYSDNIIFCIASFFSCPDTNSRKFASQLQLSLQVRHLSDNQLAAIKIISGDEESVHQVRQQYQQTAILVIESQTISVVRKATGYHQLLLSRLTCWGRDDGSAFCHSRPE